MFFKHNFKNIVFYRFTPRNCKMSDEYKLAAFAASLNKLKFVVPNQLS